MKKICIIGNSHSGALRIGERRLSNPNITASYFAIHGSLHPQLLLGDGKLFAKKSRMVHTDIPDAATNGFNLAEFDAVVISAWGLPNAFANFMNRTHPLVEARCASWRPVAKEGPPVVSHAVMREIVRDRLTALPALQTIQHIRSIFAGPILIQPKPKPSLGLFKDSSWELYATYGEKAADVYAHYIKIHDEISRSVISSLASKPIMLDYPEVDGDSGFSVSDEYNQSPSEYWHKNGAYGKVVMRQICAIL